MGHLFITGSCYTESCQSIQRLESYLANESLCLELNLYLQELGKNISANALMLHGITRKINVWTAQRKYMLKWTAKGLLEQGPLPGQQVIVWFHDKSIFYAHDCHQKSWFHKDAPARPYHKGEGHSFMVACFFSCDFGWLCASDGWTAEQFMFPGKVKDGYFTNVDIVEQANAAIDLVNELYPEFDHIFINDNTTTHLKCKDTALSAQKMSKGPSSKFYGNIVHLPDGLVSKVKTQMGPATFTDGSHQQLYHPDGVFKGIAAILAEHDIKVPACAECKVFKCVAPMINCCCCCVLYNQPDFGNVESILETTCRERGVLVRFLPNFIRLYHPESSCKDDLKRNAIEFLDTNKFIDAYCKGLNGQQAAWAAHKYKGHCILPDSLMDDLEKANIL
ncbi:hypothetical protein BT96DRAFT_958713 [Gymnopus androsaceus JB14]|uniref:Uncharacterized protein n=1 Tax=Gymnopus androsaceus JB14 TaxID=1447944 RepID=A0A6A4HC78_9AGAR|nr:hypothetical protein BT96DRAFT_958713 [Gymnopus androsaceus JB14]